MAYYGVRHWAERWGPWGPSVVVAERMRAFAAAGAAGVIDRVQRFADKPATDCRRLRIPPPNPATDGRYPLPFGVLPSPRRGLAVPDWRE